MLDAVGTALSSVIGWIGTVISSIVTSAGTGTAAGALNALLPLFALGIAVTVIFASFRIIRGLTWGA